MGKDTYIFRREWRDCMSDLTSEEKSEVYSAIEDYAFDGIVPENLARVPRIIFNLIKGCIDRDNEAYEAKLEQNRSNGRRGGRPSKCVDKPDGFSETERFSENPPVFNETEKSEGFSEKPKKPHSDSDNDNDNDSYSSVRPCAREDGVSESDPCVISKEEEKDFFEIFFFKNFLDPWKQTERFIAHNSSRGWRGDRGAVFDSPRKRLSLARLWEQKDSPPGSKRFPDWFIDVWKRAYAIAKDGELRNAEVADEMLSRTVSAETGINLKDRRINCGKSFGMWYKEHEDILSPIFRGIQIYVKK